MARNDNEVSLDILQTLFHDPSTLKLPDPELVNYYYYENGEWKCLHCSGNSTLHDFDTYCTSESRCRECPYYNR